MLKFQIVQDTETHLNVAYQTDISHFNFLLHLIKEKYSGHSPPLSTFWQKNAHKFANSYKIQEI